MDAPICRKCGDEQVQLFDWLASPALWKCRRCGHFWPDERASNVELWGERSESHTNAVLGTVANGGADGTG